jgi:hypothetical protein
VYCTCQPSYVLSHALLPLYPGGAASVDSTAACIWFTSLRVSGLEFGGLGSVDGNAACIWFASFEFKSYTPRFDVDGRRLHSMVDRLQAYETLYVFVYLSLSLSLTLSLSLSLSLSHSLCHRICVSVSLCVSVCLCDRCRV